MSRRRASILAAFVAGVWGLCFVVIQWSLPTPAPLLLAALRSLIGGAVLATWLVWRGRSDAHAAPQPRHVQGIPPWRVLLVLALANSTLAFGAMYLAAGRTEAAVASVLTGAQPLILAAAGWRIFAERLEGRTVAGLLVAMSGVIIVSMTASSVAGLDGVALALLAAGAPVAGTVVMRRLAPGTDPLRATSAQFLLGGAILLMGSAITEPWTMVAWSPPLVASLLFLGIIGTGFAYAVWFRLLPEVPLVRLGTILFLVPVTGLVVAVVLGERLEPLELLGAATILAGVGLGQRWFGRDPRPGDLTDGDPVARQASPSPVDGPLAP